MTGDLRETAPTIAVWPRLFDVHLAAQYCSVGEQTIRDWVVAELLSPVPMPGSTLRDKAGNIIAHAKDRRIAKILLAKEDVDRLIDERKGGA